MRKRRVLVTGAAGQLGRAILKMNKPDWECIGLNSSELDITRWRDVRDTVSRVAPDLVIHAAAATNVDRCEREPEWCFGVNALGSRYVAQAARDIAADIVYISTNYVFDGTKELPYHEFDVPDPISVYGASKLAGERESLAAMSRCHVIRTASVFSSGGGNFVATMRRLMEANERITVVDDQTSNPTFTVDLAKAIVEVVERAPFGTYHVTNSEAASWHEWAVEIKKLIDANCRVDPIPASQYKRDATPPMNGTMISLALADSGIKLPPWRVALKQCLQQWPE